MLCRLDTSGWRYASVVVLCLMAMGAAADRPCPTYEGVEILSHSIDPFTIQPFLSVACYNDPDNYTTANWYARAYDLDAYFPGEDFYYITCVEFGIDRGATEDVPAHCNIYRDVNGYPPWRELVDLLPIAGFDFVVRANQGPEVLAIVFDQPVAFDLNDADWDSNWLVVEMHVEESPPGSIGVWPGCNAVGQTDATFFRAPDCDFTLYVPLEDIGYPDVHWVNSVIGTTDLCPGDFDGDGDVDTADLLFLLGAWGTPDGDVDGDGDTDTADLLALLAAWGECP
jgi:hypothetical protein